MILLDNTVLSNFALVKQMSLLNEYCGDIAATTADVLDEFERGVKEQIFAETGLSWLKRLDLNEKEKTGKSSASWKRKGLIVSSAGTFMSPGIRVFPGVVRLWDLNQGRCRLM